MSDDTDLSGPANPPVDIAALHAAIVTDLSTVFPTVKSDQVPVPWTIQFYLRQAEKWPLPCILLELTSIEKGQNGGAAGNGQWAATINFEAFVITDYLNKQLDYRIQSRVVAAALVAFLSDHVFTAANVSPVEVHGSYPDSFKPAPGGKQYDCMRVDFQVDGLIGTDIFAQTGDVPAQIYLGFAPKVGTGHEADYVEVV